jgi:hypothetical protein
MALPFDDFGCVSILGSFLVWLCNFHWFLNGSSPLHLCKELLSWFPVLYLQHLSAYQYNLIFIFFSILEKIIVFVTVDQNEAPDLPSSAPLYAFGSCIGADSDSVGVCQAWSIFSLVCLKFGIFSKMYLMLLNLLMIKDSLTLVIETYA